MSLGLELPVCVMGFLFVLSGPSASGAAPSYISDRAVSISRGLGYPALSDVSFSSRWYRSPSATEVHDTFAEAPLFFTTRLDWVYDRGNAGRIVNRANEAGWYYSGAINPGVFDTNGGRTRTIGRDLTITGNFVGDGIGDFWSEEFFQVVRAYLVDMIQNGADAVQVDDPGGSYDQLLNGESAGYGLASDAHFRQWIYSNSTPEERTLWGLPASFTDTYRNWVLAQGGESALPAGLRDRFKAHMLEGLLRFYNRCRAEATALNGGTPVPFSCNIGSNFSWGEGNYNSWVDYAMPESRIDNISARIIRDSLRSGESKGKGLLISPPRYDAPAPGPDYVDLTRKSIASTYALGGVMMVPWDVWQNYPDSFRYYGTPAEFADLYGFIRSIPTYFDGYEEVFSLGEETEVSASFELTDAPIWFAGGSGRILGSVRAKPGQRDQPVMIHLVEWGTPQGFDLILDPAQFFDGAAVTATLYTPTTYNATTHQAAIASGNLSSLHQIKTLTPSIRSDGRYVITIPPLNPWGVVYVQRNAFSKVAVPPMATAQLRQDFRSFTPGNLFIDPAGATNETVTGASANPSTGYRWGAYNGVGGDTDGDSVRLWNVGPTNNGVASPVLWFRNTGSATGNNMRGSYAYTVTTSQVNLSSGGMLKLGITESWDGYMGGGNNGSGLPGRAGEVRNTVLRLLIRNGSGKWYASGYFAPNLYETPTRFTGQNEVEYVRDISRESWYEVTNPGTMNALTNNDESPITISGTAAVNPDLSSINGMGIYVWNLFDASGALEISRIGIEPFTVYTGQTMSQDFRSFTSGNLSIDPAGVKNETVTVASANPSTGYRWGAYNGAGGDTDGDSVWLSNVGPANNGVASPVLWFRNTGSATGRNMRGSYAYTVTTNHANLSSGGTLKLGITELWDGWMQNGSNGSGLPGEAGEVRNTVLRLLIRNSYGKWYASGYFAPNSRESNLGLNEANSMFTGQNEVEYIRDISRESWYEVTNSGTMNALTNNDESPITISGTAAVNPDLSGINGMGIYVWNLYDNPNGTLEISRIRIESAAAPLPIVTAPASSNVTGTSATLRGDVTSDGGLAISERGVVLAATTISSDPYLGGAGVTKVATTGAIGAFTVPMTGLTAGTNYSFKAYVTNSVGTSYTSVGSFTTLLTRAENWRQTYFPGSTQTTGPGADIAIPLGDGVSNLIKFATGMDPTRPGRMPGMVGTNSNNLTFTYTPSTDAVADGVTFTVEYSDTLNAGGWKSDIVNQGNIGSGGNPVTATVAKGSSGRRFLRLKITSSPR